MDDYDFLMSVIKHWHADNRYLPADCLSGEQILADETMYNINVDPPAIFIFNRRVDAKEEYRLRQKMPDVLAAYAMQETVLKQNN